MSPKTPQRLMGTTADSPKKPKQTGAEASNAMRTEWSNCGPERAGALFRAQRPELKTPFNKYKASCMQQGHRMHTTGPASWQAGGHFDGAPFGATSSNVPSSSRRTPCRRYSCSNSPWAHAQRCMRRNDGGDERITGSINE